MNDRIDYSGQMERIADALEVQNALLLEVVKQQHRARVDQHPDPGHSGPSATSIATDVVDSYGDLYGGDVAGWPFDPIADQTEDMGDR